MFNKNNKFKENITRIIYFISSPFNDRDYERFGIELVQKNGYEVEVWDFSPFLNPDRFKNSSDSSRNIFKKYRVFLNVKGAVYQIRNLRNDCFCILLVDFSYKSYRIFHALTKNTIPYSIQRYNFLTYDLDTSNSYLRKIQTFSFKAILNSIFIKYIPYSFIGVGPAKILLFLGGKTDLSKLKIPINEETKIVYSHYYDYDLYLKEIQKPLFLDKKKCVYLDSFLPFHPDFGTKQIIKPEKYYQSLCVFFNFLEQKYRVEIIIAAHPRSDYETRPEYFGGRKIIKGKTAELVRNSGLVICHESASVSFAVLFEKPTIFVTFEGLNGTVTGMMINCIAGLLDKKPINLDDNLKIDWDKEMIVNKEAYRSYRNKYIKEEGTEELPIWQTFVNHLKNV
jgi:hypothetical protein